MTRTNKQPPPLIKTHMLISKVYCCTDIFEFPTWAQIPPPIEFFCDSPQQAAQLFYARRVESNPNQPTKIYVWEKGFKTETFTEINLK